MSVAQRPRTVKAAAGDLDTSDPATALAYFTRAGGGAHTAAIEAALAPVRRNRAARAEDGG